VGHVHVERKAYIYVSFFLLYSQHGFQAQKLIYKGGE